MVVGLLVGIPGAWAVCFEADQRLRASQPVQVERVSRVVVHAGKTPWVEVWVAVPGGEADVDASWDVDSAPAPGDPLAVVIDPSHPSRAVMADPDTDLIETVPGGAGLAGFLGLCVLVPAWGPGMPPGRVLRRLARRSPDVQVVTVVQANERPVTPRDWLHRGRGRGVDPLRPVDVGLLPDDGTPELMARLLVAPEHRLRKGERAIAVGCLADGGTVVLWPVLAAVLGDPV